MINHVNFNAENIYKADLIEKLDNFFRVMLRHTGLY